MTSMTIASIVGLDDPSTYSCRKVGGISRTVQAYDRYEAAAIFLAETGEACASDVSGGVIVQRACCDTDIERVWPDGHTPIRGDADTYRWSAQRISRWVSESVGLRSVYYDCHVEIEVDGDSESETCLYFNGGWKWSRWCDGVVRSGPLESIEDLMEMMGTSGLPRVQYTCHTRGWASDRSVTATSPEEAARVAVERYGAPVTYADHCHVRVVEMGAEGGHHSMHRVSLYV